MKSAASVTAVVCYSDDNDSNGASHPPLEGKILDSSDLFAFVYSPTPIKRRVYISRSNTGSCTDNVGMPPSVATQVSPAAVT
ncbi:hypothetical protein EGR_11151 [Echinococcus granulosus]|uniref:Uncharacterized protein n=1 Tax=Echinococcus granulosus TaxID=6210 RepID=W6U6P5_ECHGR|nr:hypothetical protein EGR_11151 [Echinococcus granulosus]EUB53992.1 hypothetical protein EGR_11151 [Echinococcus granulosus]